MTEKDDWYDVFDRRKNKRKTLSLLEKGNHNSDITDTEDNWYTVFDRRRKTLKQQDSDDLINTYDDWYDAFDRRSKVLKQLDPSHHDDNDATNVVDDWYNAFDRRRQTLNQMARVRVSPSIADAPSKIDLDSMEFHDSVVFTPFRDATLPGRSIDAAQQEHSSFSLTTANYELGAFEYLRQLFTINDVDNEDQVEFSSFDSSRRRNSGFDHSSISANGRRGKASKRSRANSLVRSTPVIMKKF